MKTKEEIKKALQELIDRFTEDTEANHNAGEYYMGKGLNDMALIATSKATTWDKAAYDLKEIVECIEC